ncbi:hypothetical protein DPMN_148792 [Dreissena polymorpha]|uniref:Uncharacterized protein n=1 Tax=Dreissena polymorpha TaxID=45954 RepID=A0A9D4J470_DREPO|nr:hypothetical protein DPMN_148792 [Dreissena polymorpha]
MSFNKSIDRLKRKLGGVRKISSMNLLPGTRGTSGTSGLDPMLKDSIYLAWSVASVQNSPESRRDRFRKSRALDDNKSWLL